MSHMSIRAALERAHRLPQLTPEDDLLERPVHELISRVLFDLATYPDLRVRGAANRANEARRIIANRLGGTRRPGTHPAVARDHAIEFADLTEGAIDAK